MRIWAFVQKKCMTLYNNISGKIIYLTNSVATNLDANLQKSRPVVAQMLNKFGITPRTAINEVQALFGFLAEKGKDLVGAATDLGLGFWEVTATFLPLKSYNSLKPGMPKILSSIRVPELSKDFKRGVSRNLFFLLYNVALYSPVLASSYLTALYKRFLSNSNGENQINNSYGNAFYFLAAFNLLMIYKFLGYGRLLSKYKAFLYEDTLNSIVINEKASRLVTTSIFDSLIKEDSNKGTQSLFFDPRPESLKKIIGAKIFASTEALINDTLMLGLLAFNDMVIGSRFITGAGLAIRSYIMGKDLGTSRLATTGLSGERQKRIKKNRHGRFTGQGAAFFSAGYLSQSLFYSKLGLTASIFALPVNWAIASLLYKFFMVSSYAIEIEARDADWDERKGISFTEIFQPIFFDPLIERYLNRIERKLKAGSKLIKSDKEQKERVEITKVDTHISANTNDEKSLVVVSVENNAKQVTEQESLFWNNLMKNELIEAETAFLKIHATNLIFLLSIFQQSRASGGQYFVSLLSLVFPRRIQEIIKICLKELTDNRIEQMIKFLVMHEVSALLEPRLKPETPSGEDSYVYLENDNNSVNQNLRNNAIRSGEIEVFRVSPDDINIRALNLQVATFVRNEGNMSIIDFGYAGAVAEILQNVRYIPKKIFQIIFDYLLVDIEDEDKQKVRVQKNLSDLGPDSIPQDPEDFDDLSDIDMWTAPHEQYYCENPSGRQGEHQKVAEPKTTVIRRIELSVPMQQLFHYWHLIKRATPAERIEMVAQGVVIGAQSIKNKAEAVVPGGLETVKVAAAAATLVVGTPAAVVGAGAYVVHKVTKHRDTILTGAAAAKNVEDNLSAEKIALRNEPVPNEGTGAVSSNINTSTSASAANESPKSRVNADSKLKTENATASLDFSTAPAVTPPIVQPPSSSASFLPQFTHTTSTLSGWYSSANSWWNGNADLKTAHLKKN